MKGKKLVSVFLVLVMVVSILASTNVIGYAAETTNSTADTDVLEKADGLEEQEIPGAAEIPAFSGSRDEEKISEILENIEDMKSADTSGSDEAETSMSANLSKEADVSQSAKIQKVPETPKTSQESRNDEIAPFSLLPLQERNAYLALNDFTDEQLKEVPVSTVLERLKDIDGNSIEVLSAANAVWAYFKDEDGDIIDDEYHVISRDETVDMTPRYSGYVRYNMELIIGSGKQLDSSSIRYNVRVYITNKINEKISCELFTEDTGYRYRVYPDRTQPIYSSILNIELISMFYLVPTHEKGQEYYLNIISEAVEHPDVKVDVYTMMEFMLYSTTGGGTPITDRVLNQKNMYKTGSGYNGTFDAPENVTDSDNIFFLVYKDAETGQQITYKALSVIVVDDIAYIEGKAYDYENNQMTDIEYESVSYHPVSDMELDMAAGTVTNADYVENVYVTLKEGYSANEEHYYVFNAHSNIWTDDANGHVVKAVVGLYNTLEEAADQADIKEQLIPVDRNTVPYGYKANYDRGIPFTIFFDDGTVFKFNVEMFNFHPVTDDYMREYDDAPLIGETDPWFRVNGVKWNEHYLDTYIVQNSYKNNLDTLYGYGYQTLLIMNTDVDMSQLKPVFYLGGNGNRVEAYVGTKQTSGESIQDFSGGTIQYTGLIDGNEKNYQVAIVKKEHGPKLFVNGPGERSVFLDEYFEYRHDIMIANVGDEPLTGLNVELINATNVKLDDYWTVGGEGNDTLAAFDTTNSYATQNGELPNIAKIRLLPDGDGDITGTLRISADGQEPVDIILSGRASNPNIVTQALEDAVKYVPYSYLIATDNMHDWNRVDFSIESGDLPIGMQMYEATGEIYGVPRETGEFPIHVKATYSRSEFTPSYADFILVVKENSNDNVYNASDDGYVLLESIGEDTNDNHDYYLEDYSEDQLFVSSGEFGDFIDLWLNGEKLTEGEDYTKEEGSTRITVRSQTFANKADKNGSNTIAAEFREDGNINSDLRRTAQNFRLEKPDSSDSQTPQATQTPKPTQTSQTTQTPQATQTSQTTQTPQATQTPRSTRTVQQTGATGSDSQSVTCIMYFVDGDDNPLANLPLELHSTPQTASTNAGGQATFQNVEFGNHTIYVNDENGESKASKDFKIQSGQTLKLENDTVTVPSGSSFAVTVRYDNDELTFLSMKSEGGSKNAPKTGDDSMVGLWTILLLLSSLVLLRYYKRRGRVL